MKTIKTILFVVLCSIPIPMLTANCSDKKTVEKAEKAEKAETAGTTEETESVMKVASPPFKQFVVVTTEDVGLYKKADTNSPTLVRWIESECESDFCENFYQWSDQPGKSGYELSPEIIAYESRVFPLLGEEGKFYKVYTLNEWCDIESAYIPKDCVGNIESATIKADMLEAEDNYLKCRIVKDGKYKDIVLIDEYDELNGENLQVGVLKDGVIAIPAVYNIYCQMLTELEGTSENLEIKEDEGSFYLNYTKSLSMTAEEEYESYQLDLKKLSLEQITKIIDTVTTKNPEYVKYMYHFPAQGLQSFYYMAK